MFLNRLSDKNKKLFFALEMLMANSDGSFDDAEERIMRNHCSEMGIPYDQELQNICMDDILKAMNESISNVEKKIFYIELLTVALIDNEYDDKEREFAKQLQSVLGIPDEIADQAHDLVKRLLDVSTMLENFVEW